MSETKVEPTKARPAMRSPTTILLRRSKIVMVYDADFSTEDTILAQKAAGKKAALFVLYLAQRIATFDGQRLTIGEIQERIRGKDYLQVTGALLGDGDDEDDGAPEGELGKDRPN